MSSGNHNRRDQGNVCFQTLLVLPVLIALAAVGIDISGWNAARDELQKFADSVALEGARYLPDMEAAFSHIQTTKLPRHLSGLQMSAFEIGENRLSVGARLSGRFEPQLSKVLPGLSSSAFEITKEAVAQIVPSDTVFIISDGTTLRPRLAPSNSGRGSEFQIPWGDPETWPASGYFNCAAPPILRDSKYPFNWWERWDDTGFQRWATQSCFNPVFSALKLSAISLIDSLSSAPENRLGLIFTPGGEIDQGYLIVKRVRRESLNPKLNSIRWPGYLEGERFLGDEVCLLFSHPLSSFTDRFQLPPSRFGEPFRALADEGCTVPLPHPPCGERHSPDGHLTQCFLDEVLSLRQAVYWHAARLSLPDYDAMPRIFPALEAAIQELTDPDLGAETDKLVRLRGSLAFRSMKRILLFSDVLPLLSGPDSENLLRELRRHRISLIIIAYQHFGLSAPETATLLTNLRSWSESEVMNQRNIRTVLAQSPEDLQSRVVPQLLLVDRQIVLRR